MQKFTKAILVIPYIDFSVTSHIINPHPSGHILLQMSDPIYGLAYHVTDLLNDMPMLNVEIKMFCSYIANCQRGMIRYILLLFFSTPKIADK